MRTSRVFAGLALLSSAGFAYACSSDATLPAETTAEAEAGADVTTAAADGSAPVDAGASDALDSAVPTDAAPPLPPNTVVQLALGADHTCALLYVGDVWCWGTNAFAQQGNGTVDTALHAPAKVAALSGIVGISAGNHHTCAVDTLGVVRCWGSNQIMQLGHDNTLDGSVPDAGGDVACGPGLPCNPTPRPVTGLGAAKSVAAKVFESCARLANGEVKCWGYNGSTGFLGHLPPDLTCFFGAACNFNASTVSGAPGGPLAISSSSGCVLGGNVVSCWGSNVVSQLATAADSNPHVTPVPVTGLPAITAIGAGNSTPYAIGPGGALFGWGSNSAGELGGGCDAAAAAPQLIIEAGVSAVTGGSQFACALSSAGIVSCWGSASHGPLGPTVDASATCQPPTVITGLAGVTQMGLGLGHVCAVKGDNSVWCWGYNNTAQTGHDPSVDSTCTGTKCNPTPAKVVGLP